MNHASTAILECKSWGTSLKESETCLARTMYICTESWKLELHRQSSMLLRCWPRPVHLMNAVLVDVEKYAETLAEARTNVEAVRIKQLFIRELCRFGISARQLLLKVPRKMRCEPGRQS